MKIFLDLSAFWQFVGLAASAVCCFGLPSAILIFYGAKYVDRPDKSI